MRAMMMVVAMMGGMVQSPTCVAQGTGFDMRGGEARRIQDPKAQLRFALFNNCMPVTVVPHVRDDTDNLNIDEALLRDLAEDKLEDAKLASPLATSDLVVSIGENQGAYIAYVGYTKGVVDPM